MAGPGFYRRGGGIENIPRPDAIDGLRDAVAITVTLVGGGRDAIRDGNQVHRSIVGVGDPRLKDILIYCGLVTVHLLPTINVM
jgi:hypothetical protein